MICPNCRELEREIARLKGLLRRFGWQDIDRTTMEVERVYETRYDCEPMLA